MTNDAKHYLSQEKYNELEKELVVLKGTKRKEIAAQLEFAKSLGDLSENAEYQEARENQAALEDRISKLEIIIKNASILKDTHGGFVEIGTKITLQKEGEKTPITFAITGSEEADIAGGKLSNESPLGRAVLGKKKGDKATVATPKGKVVYTIVDIA
jgi:transcription elongation factor GreA